VSYQPSDLREVMFRLKGTYDCKYETVGDIGRSLPLIPLCLRALVRHRAHMNKFDKFSKNDFYEIFLWMFVMLFCLSYECVYFIQTLLYLLSESSRCMFVLQATRVSSLYIRSRTGSVGGGCGVLEMVGVWDVTGIPQLCFFFLLVWVKE
jgi:hypothetical protein